MTRRVEVTERHLRTLWGYCLPETGRIVIARGISERDRLGTLVHELLHVGLPATTEDEIDRLTAILARVLWRQGYRRRVKDSSRGS